MSSVRINQSARVLTASMLAVILLVPFLVALNTSLKTPSEIVNVLSLPSAPNVANYRAAWEQIGGSFVNSIAITVPSVIFSVGIGAIAAYPLSRIHGSIGRVVYFVLLTGMLVPYQIIQIPLFMLVRGVNLYNTVEGMWLVHTAYGVPICTFFMRNVFAGIPRSMFEAALLDGCGPVLYFAKVLIPASRSGLAALAIIQSRAIWNDLLFAMTLTNSPNARPVTVELSALTSGLEIQYGPLMAATVMSIVPVLTAYLLFQRAFVQGMLGGSEK